MSLKICLPISSWKLSQVSSINNLLSRSNFHSHTKELEPHTFQIWQGVQVSLESTHSSKDEKGTSGFLHSFIHWCFCRERFQDHQNPRYFAAALGISCCWSMEPTTSFGCFVCDIFHTFEDWGLAYFPEIMNKEMLKVTYYLPYTLAQPFIFPYTLGCMVARKTNASAVTNWPPNTCGKHCLIESWYSPQEYI